MIRPLTHNKYFSFTINFNEKTDTKKIIILIFIVAAFTSCKKNEVKDNCGCNEIIKYTIPDDKPLYGSIFFVEEAGQDTTSEFSFKFDIIYIEKTLYKLRSLFHNL